MSGAWRSPCSTKCSAICRSPESKISISGVTPAAWTRCAMISRLRGVLITTAVPEYIVLKSSVHTSGRSASTCATRFSGCVSVVPGAATRGSSSEGMKRPPSPVERFRITSTSAARMRATISAKRSARIVPRPVSGSRACRCTIAAPARAASTALCAISAGVTGSAGFCSRLVRLPVTAQVRMVLVRMWETRRSSCGRRRRAAARR